MSDFSYLIPEFFLFFSTIMVLFSRNKEFFGCIFLAITAYLVFLYQHYIDVSAFNDLLFFGKITQTMKIVSLLLSSIVALMMYAVKDNMKFKQDFSVEIPTQNQNMTMFMFSMLGSLFVMSSNNFMSLYVSLELQTLPLYVMAASDRFCVKSSESGVKYFVLGSVASCIMVFGISILYIELGELSFLKLEDALLMKHNFAVVISIIFVISGLLFKLAVVPFHLWIADVYSGSPKGVAAFFAIVPKISIIVLLCRIFDTNLIFSYFTNDVNNFSDISFVQNLFRNFLFISGAFSVFLGALAAVMQTNIRRLFAYGAINHIGYIVIGIAVSKCPYDFDCLLSAPIIYTVFYSVLNIGIFSCVLLFKHDNIHELSGLAKNKKILSFCFSVLLLSSAGIPPLAGFFVKLKLISAVISSGFDLLAFFILFSTGFTLYYYLKIIKIMYFDKSELNDQIEHSNLLIIFVIVVSIINILFFLSLFH